MNEINNETIERITLINFINSINRMNNNQEARINSLLSRRYFNSPPTGGYLFNYIDSNESEEENSEYYLINNNER